MEDRQKIKEVLIKELEEQTEELGRQNMIMIGCRLKIVGLQREIRNIKERLGMV